MTAPSFIETPQGRRIAYHQSAGQGPGIVFLGGFRSDMTGSKALYFEAEAQKIGSPYLRLDYSGHGASSEDFLDGCIGDWAEDAQDAITRLTTGPQVIVGSSMGGWISLILSQRIPERFKGLVGIAAAPDFTEDGMWQDMSAAQRADLAQAGRIELPSDYSDEPYVITRRLIEDGRNRLVLRQPLPLPFPVRLLHGTADKDVPLPVALRLLEHATCADMRLTLVKDAGHRLSEPHELQMIWQAITDVRGAQ